MDDFLLEGTFSWVFLMCPDFFFIDAGSPFVSKNSRD